MTNNYKIDPNDPNNPIDENLGYQQTVAVLAVILIAIVMIIVFGYYMYVPVRQSTTTAQNTNAPSAAGNSPTTAQDTSNTTTSQQTPQMTTDTKEVSGTSKNQPP